MFWWGNYIPSKTAEAYDAYPDMGMSMYGKFDIDELIRERDNERLIGFYEGYYADGQETKGSEVAIKANKTINYTNVFGYMYFISPKSYGDIAIKQGPAYTYTNTHEFQ